MRCRMQRSTGWPPMSSAGSAILRSSSLSSSARSSRTRTATRPGASKVILPSMVTVPRSWWTATSPPKRRSAS
eukprot:791177-Prymnesium_polylepis.1